MLITQNGQIDGRPEVSMVRRAGIWYRLLACCVADTYTDAELEALFATDTVEDDAIQVKWCYTTLDSIQSSVRDGVTYKYVWLTYTSEISTRAADETLEEALNILGVDTEEEIPANA